MKKSKGDCRTDLIGGGGRDGCTYYIFHKGMYRGGHGAKPPNTQISLLNIINHTASQIAK